MSRKQERIEKIKRNIIESLDYIAENLSESKDLEFRSCKEGVAIYEVSKRRYRGIDGNKDLM